jgi:hypothetical protein
LVGVDGTSGGRFAAAVAVVPSVGELVKEGRMLGESSNALVECSEHMFEATGCFTVLLFRDSFSMIKS